MSDATSGMSSDYDDHSEYQRKVAESGYQLLRTSVRAVGPPASGSFTIADYGCSEGRNSMAAFAEAIDEYRTLDRPGTIVTIHNDLPTNDWTALFANIDGPDGYLGEAGSVVPMASGVSFFEPATPRGSVHLGMSFNAAHWLQKQPDVDAPGALYFDAVSGAEREHLAAVADADLGAFLAARARDLAPDGRLLVQCVGSLVDPAAPGGVRATAGKLLAVMQDVAATMVADGRLDAEHLDRYVLPVYARTEDEARHPFEEDPILAAAFEILRIAVSPVPSPYEAMLSSTGDAEAYADAYVGFVRGFTESTLREGLFGDRPGEDLDDFYTRLRDRFAAEPGRHPFEDWTLTMWLRRTNDRAV